MNKQEKGKCSMAAYQCCERANQRRHNDNKIIRPGSKKVSLHERERLGWERFYGRKSKLFSKHFDLVVGQLSLAEILSGIRLNRCDAPISQISFQRQPDNFQRTVAQGVDRCLFRDAISL